MNVKVKTALIIIITLIIGIFLGAMLNRALLRHRIQKTFSMHKPDRLVFFIEEVIQPEAEQRDQIRAIVEKHAGHMEEMRRKFFTEMQSERESFLKEIEPLLTPEQKERLKKGPRGLFPGRRPFPERRGPRPDREHPWPKHKRPPEEKNPDKPDPRENE
ncbi:hypothetical protein ACFLT2_06690 [Acidobacteriota bacterium]